MRTNIYICDKDKEILDFLKTKDNASRYISRLIRNDMDNNHPLTKEDIIRLINDYSQNSNNSTQKLSLSEMFDS